MSNRTEIAELKQRVAALEKVVDKLLGVEPYVPDPCNPPPKPKKRKLVKPKAELGMGGELGGIDYESDPLRDV